MCWIPHIKMNRFLSLVVVVVVVHVDITCLFDQFIWGVCARFNVTRHMRMCPISFVTGQAIIFFGVVYFFCLFVDVLGLVAKAKKIETQNLHPLWKSMSCINMCQFIVGCCVATFDAAAAIAVTCHLLSTWLFRVHCWWAIHIMGLLWLRLG